MVPVLITIIIVIVIVILANLGSYAHHRYRHCYSYRLILVPLCSLLQMFCSTSGVPFPSPHCPMSSFNAEFNPTFGIFQQTEIVDSLCSSATFWQTSDQVKVTEARCHSMSCLDPWAGKSRNGQKTFFLALLLFVKICIFQRAHKDNEKDGKL